MTNGNDIITSKSWNVMQAFVAVTVLIGFFGIIFAWMVFPPKTTDAGVLAILNQLTGAVTTLAVSVVTYYVGSSKSSADKEETQKQSAQAAVAVASAAAATASDTAKTTAATLDKVVSSTGNGTPMAAKTVIMNQPDVHTDLPVEKKT